MRKRGQRNGRGNNECGCATEMNFSSGLKCNCNAWISTLGSSLAVTAGASFPFASDAQRVRAKVCCAVLCWENRQSKLSGVGVRVVLRAGRGGI